MLCFSSPFSPPSLFSAIFLCFAFICSALFLCFALLCFALLRFALLYSSAFPCSPLPLVSFRLLCSALLSSSPLLCSLSDLLCFAWLCFAWLCFALLCFAFLGFARSPSCPHYYNSIGISYHRSLIRHNEHLSLFFLLSQSSDAAAVNVRPWVGNSRICDVFMSHLYSLECVIWATVWSNNPVPCLSDQGD